MRGTDTFIESLFSMRKLDEFVPNSHPLRSIRVMANEALAKMDRLFAGMYEADAKGGRLVKNLAAASSHFHSARRQCHPSSWPDARRARSRFNGSKSPT